MDADAFAVVVGDDDAVNVDVGLIIAVAVVDAVCVAINEFDNDLAALGECEAVLDFFAEAIAGFEKEEDCVTVGTEELDANVEKEGLSDTSGKPEDENKDELDSMVTKPSLPIRAPPEAPPPTVPVTRETRLDDNDEPPPPPESCPAPPPYHHRHHGTNHQRCHRSRESH